MPKPAIFGLVKDEKQARTVLATLETVGFIPTDVSVLGNHQMEYDVNGNPLPGFARTRDIAHTNSTKAPEGATAGVATGGALGGLAGWLVAIGALAVPGLAPFAAAGPIMGALSGAAVGATAGGITGALIGYGIPEYEAKLYAGRIESGHILIGVHAVDEKEAEAARQALENAGAEDIKVAKEIGTES